VGSAAGGSATPAATGTAVSSNVAGLLAYILGFVTGIIFLVIERYKNDELVRFHAFQSIVLCGVYIVSWVAFLVVESMVSSGYNESLRVEALLAV
jgi:uncharacterized membrane protein